VRIRPRLRNKLEKIDPNELAALGIEMALDETGQGKPPEFFPAEHIIRIMPPKKSRKKPRKPPKPRRIKAEFPEALCVCTSIASDAVVYVRNIWLFYSVTKEAVRNWPKIRKLMTSVGIEQDEIITLGLSKTLKPTPKKRKPAKKK